MPKFTITYQYSTDNWKSEYKDFPSKKEADAYADKQKEERKAKHVYVR